MEATAFQDQFTGNFCFGCGPANQDGLQIKSYWADPGKSVCTFQPKPYHTAGPRQFLNGGIIATVIDCHCVSTAIAQAYHDEGRPLDSAPPIWYVTGSLAIKYLRPTPIDRPVQLTAHIVETGPKKTVLSCSLSSGGQECATGEVIAIRVPWSWREKETAG